MTKEIAPDIQRTMPSSVAAIKKKPPVQNKQEGEENDLQNRAEYVPYWLFNGG